MNDPLTQTATASEDYIEGHLFDPAGIMYSYVDVETGQPFDRAAITTRQVPVRAHFDPWSYWTYEDSIATMGLYLDGLVRKYAVTREPACLERAHKLWLVIRNIYACSQAHGIGSFFRPYGGYVKMGAFAEPLGTDQASPLFSGLYLYSQHADADTRTQIAAMLVQTLGWYEQQGFRYFYYKTFIHPWEPGWQHAASYYLPAIAWAAKITGDRKWRELLTAKLALFQKPEYHLYHFGQGSFCWGSDLPMLKDLLGDEFEGAFPRPLFDRAFQSCLTDLERYVEPGTTCYQHAEAKQPGFKPHVLPIEPPYARDCGLGFPELYTVHQGRVRPRHETHFLCALAVLGYPGAAARARQLLTIAPRVPQDFTNIVADENSALPETVIAARSVGIMLVEWFRNYWLLRACA